MGDAAEQLIPEEVVYAFGRVVEKQHSLKVETSFGICRARRAVSCLIEVEEGDRVLIAMSDSGEAYVVAVLERAGATKTQIVFDGHADIRVPEGRFQVTASDGVELATPRDMAIASARFNLSSKEAEISVNKMSFVGSFVRTQVERIKLATETMNMIVGTLYQHATCVFRRTDEIEELRANNIDYKAEESFALHGKYTLLTANELVKVDSEQIHLG